VHIGLIYPKETKYNLIFYVVLLKDQISDKRLPARAEALNKHFVAVGFPSGKPKRQSGFEAVRSIGEGPGVVAGRFRSFASAGHNNGSLA